MNIPLIEGDVSMMSLISLIVLLICFPGTCISIGMLSYDVNHNINNNDYIYFFSFALPLLIIGFYQAFKKEKIYEPSQWEQRNLDKKNNRLIYSKDADYYKASDFKNDFKSPISKQRINGDNKN